MRDVTFPTVHDDSLSRESQQQHITDGPLWWHGQRHTVQQVFHAYKNAPCNLFTLLCFLPVTHRTQVTGGCALSTASVIHTETGLSCMTA